MSVCHETRSKRKKGSFMKHHDDIGLLRFVVRILMMELLTKGIGARKKHVGKRQARFFEAHQWAFEDRSSQ